MVWGPQSPHPSPFLLGCLNEQDACDPPGLEARASFLGHPPVQINSAQPAGLPPLVASLLRNVSICPTGKPRPALQPLGSEVRVELLSARCRWTDSKVIALTLPGQDGTELFHSHGHRHSLGDSSVQGFMPLGQKDCEGHVARLGLSTRLESRIPGFWPSSAVLS